MRASSLFLAFATVIATASAAAYIGVLAADFVERRSSVATARALEIAGHDWVVVDVDGLQVRLTGVADSEAERFSALRTAGRVIDAGRIVDAMEVVEPVPEAPDFAAEILRNGNDISIIGLLPVALDAQHVLSLLMSEGAEVTDLLEEADFTIPAGLESATDFAARAALRLPRSQISVTATTVDIAAAVDSPEQEAQLRRDLGLLASESFILRMDLSAPRPVVTPFSLRFVREGAIGRFDVCTADTERARDTIRTAAVRSGLSGNADCILGLGAPSPKWGDASSLAIQALGAFEDGSVTLTDADVTLIAAKGTNPELFDKIIGELENALPEVFSLHAVLTPEETEKRSYFDGPAPEFLATLSPEGHVQLRGRVTNELMRDAVEGFAKARFGADHIYVATRLDGDLPKGWPVRVLASLDALSRVNYGSVVVQEGLVSLRGSTGDQETRSEIAQLLSDKLGQGQSFALDVKYTEILDPLAGLPTPQECVERIQNVQENAKISFDPGKATIDEDGLKTIDRLAVAWQDCEAVPIEISGHTDSQGRESMNMSLSQTRAEAVVDALLARRVLTSSIIAQGYGETTPIADNETEEGREANRRIEFKLIDDAALVAARRAELASDTGEEENEQN